MPEYSVWYPATSSDSASGKSNGGLFVSANADQVGGHRGRGGDEGEIVKNVAGGLRTIGKRSIAGAVHDGQQVLADV